MAELYDMRETEERVILVAVSTADGDDTEESLDELAELCRTAGADPVDRVIQNREKVHPGTYLGKGKIDEVKAIALASEATGIVCDDELSPAQMRNLEDALELKVMDRTMVILDIFAAHARTSEGKIQVELAQLKYRAVRLVGMRNSLSRLGGGIGTRGPGEKKLEVDRRRIHERIGQLKEELREVVRHREVTRASREKTGVFTAAIVGYTNAGKSTLLNALTGAGILAEDKLFATLDPTTRSYVLPDGQNILLTDTVGFIRKLPHNLVDAFRSTLEEARYCDLILHVVDASSPQMDTQMHVVYETLRELEAGDRPVITVFNKMDAVTSEELPRDLHSDFQVRISALRREGLDDLAEAIGAVIRQSRVWLEKVYDYREAGKIQLIRAKGQLISEEYREDGIYVTAWVPAEIYRNVM